MPRYRTSDPICVSHPLNQGRIAWWLAVPWLVGGPRWFDLIGQSHGSFLNTAAWKPPTRPGGSGQVAFDGSTAAVLVGNIPPLNQAFAALTVAAWVYPATTQTNNGEFVKKDVSYILRLASSGRDIQWIVWNSSLSSSLTSSGNQLTIGAWSRVVGVYDGANMTIYINGNPVATTSHTGAVKVSTNALGIGYGVATGTESLNGALDDVSIWSRGLSQNDVWADFEMSRRGYPLGSGVLNYAIDDATDVISPPALATIPHRQDGAMAGGFQTLGY